MKIHFGIHGLDELALGFYSCKGEEEESGKPMRLLSFNFFILHLHIVIFE